MIPASEVAGEAATSVCSVAEPSKLISIRGRCYDMHVHLRQGEMQDLVCSHLKESGISTFLVMPNTEPPITTVNNAVNYFKSLRKSVGACSGRLQFLMTLYFTKDLDEQEISKAACTFACSCGAIREAVNLESAMNRVNDHEHEYGPNDHSDPNEHEHEFYRLIPGVKVYPKGVTTNSGHGISIQDLMRMDSVLKRMEASKTLLLLHGEVPDSNSTDAVDASAEIAGMLTAERLFIPYVRQLADKYPELKIVMEHISTKEAVDFIIQNGPKNVGATITAHHLLLTLDDLCLPPKSGTAESGSTANFGEIDPFCYCKPIVKLEADRRALIDLIKSGNERVFFGSDSAPHPIHKKYLQGRRWEMSPSGETKGGTQACCQSGSLFKGVAAGIYSYPYVLGHLACLFEREGMLDRLEAFAS